jgi:hypothetical protein
MKEMIGKWTGPQKLEQLEYAHDVKAVMWNWMLRLIVQAQLQKNDGHVMRVGFTKNFSVA